MPGPTGDIREREKRWMACRTAYITNGLSAAQCAERFGFHVTTIKTRAAKEGWTKERDRNTTNATGVVTDELRKAAENETREHTARVERFLGQIDRLMDRFEAASSTVAVNDLKGFRSLAETMNRVAESLQKGETVHRTVGAIAETQPSDGATEKQKPRRIVFAEIEQTAETA